MSNKIDLTGYKKVRMGFLTFFCEQKEDGRLVIRYLKGFHNSVPALEVPGKCQILLWSSLSGKMEAALWYGIVHHAEIRFSQISFADSDLLCTFVP